LKSVKLFFFLPRRLRELSFVTRRFWLSLEFYTAFSHQISLRQEFFYPSAAIRQNHSQNPKAWRRTFDAALEAAMAVTTTK